MLDGDDLDEITAEHAVEDLEREIVDDSVAHAELLRDRWHERPADRMCDDILDGLVDGERESLTEALALVLVFASRGAELEARRPENPMRAATGHASGFEIGRAHV